MSSPKTNINKRIRKGLGISLFILVLTAIFAYFSIQKLIDQAALVDHTNKVILNLEYVMSKMKDAETGQRGFLLTSNPVFLEPYTGAKEKSMDYFRIVRSLTSDNIAQQERLDTLAQIIEQRFAIFAEVIKKYQVSKSLGIEGLSEGKNEMDKARAIVQRMIHAENILLISRERDARLYTFYSPIIMFVSSMIAVLFSLISFFFISRDIKVKEKIQENLDKQNFQLSGDAQLNNFVREARDMKTLGNKLLAHLTQHLNAEGAALYLSESDGSLRLKNMYAYTSTDLDKKINIGEGLIGQAALNQTISIINEVPDEENKMETALTTLSVSSLGLIPLINQGNTIGVVELIKRNSFSEDELQYLNAISEKVAMIINNLGSELRTIELLHETQNQAEELQAQQEDMRQMNEELKTSEEELKVSQEELQEQNSALEEKAQLLEEQYEAVRLKNKEVEVGRQAIELKVQQVEMVSKYKSEFLANMSHELRTPLNSILILSKIISENQDENLSTKQVEHAQIIHNSGNDLLKLISEILDLSKIESGQVVLDIQQTDPKDIVQSLGLNFKQQALTKGIEFETHISNDLPLIISTDRFRLDQILKNLLSNAFKFTLKEGKINFSSFIAPIDTSYLSESLMKSTAVIAFSVQDSGIGIPQDKQQLIFEAFQQADASTTRKYGGTGLGLTISRDLASLLGGEIRVESEENKGSTFTLFLPSDFAASDTIVRANTQDVISLPTIEEKNYESIFTQKIKRSTGKENLILIIEDDERFSHILSDFATGKKFNVLQAYNGADGLKLAQENIPDAILLDIKLPDTSGWEVLKSIRADKNLKNIQVHVMSAFDKEISDQHAGHDEYISKPVTIELLDKAFESIADKLKNGIQKVLIVEDHEGENKAISELLLVNGIKSVSAFNAKEAFELLKFKNIDCIILDLNLPLMGGYEFMEQIRKASIYSDVPIVVYSGKDLSKEEESKISKYANTVIIKNQFSYLRLLDEVQLFLHKVEETLPAKEEAAMNLHMTEEVLKNKKVLVVDDDVRNIYSLLSLLERYGMQIEVANDGKEAINIINEVKDIDIVLMDIMMPEMDGIEATKIIRQNKLYKDIPVIALTAKAMKGDKERCLEAGASDYISKPVDTDKLLTLMRVWLYKG